MSDDIYAPFKVGDKVHWKITGTRYVFEIQAMRMVRGSRVAWVTEAQDLFGRLAYVANLEMVDA